MIPSSRIKKMHFIGIGGAGMSGIAEILHDNGFIISGSDQADSEVVQYLREKGIKIHLGHAAENVEGAQLIVYSSAVNAENPEMKAGRLKKIPTIRRAEMLGELMRLKYTIAVAGTHGKTTTTSMIGHIWNTANLKPTIIVGGIVHSMRSGAQSGDGDVLIAEADEYDKSFFEMVPTMAVITNVDEDHLDCYKDIHEIEDAFVQFANKVPFYGQIVACIDEPGVQNIIPRIRKPVIRYGFSAQADYRIQSLVMTEQGCEFEIIARGLRLGKIKLNVPGKHNVKNATAAIAMALEEGISLDHIRTALESFHGARRRFEVHGNVTIANKTFLLVDDYAHHPTEVEACLTAARDNFPGRKLVAVFQPHLYTRTRDHYKSFASVFLNCDAVAVLPVYGARETPIEGVNTDMITQEAFARGHAFCESALDMDHALNFVKDHIEENTIVVVMGAGSVWKMLDLIKNSGQN
jgi:UDP-N-acetylmuramate--alanine ligase